MRRLPQGEREAWAPLLGRIVIAFGNIEHAAVSLTSACTSQAFAARVSKLKLQPRLRVLDELLRHESIATPLLDCWSAALSRVDELRHDYRNAIAHGAPVVNMHENEDGTFTFSLAHAAARLPLKRLTLAEVQTAADQCEQAHLDMVATATDILQNLALRRLLPIPQPTLPRPRRVCAEPGE